MTLVRECLNAKEWDAWDDASWPLRHPSEIGNRRWPKAKAEAIEKIKQILKSRG